MAKKQKIRISKPFYKGDGWYIEVREGASPISPVVAEYKFHSKEEADKNYRHIKIEHGVWI